MVICRYFLWRFSVLCSTLNFMTDSYTWPLLVYMLLICIYPFTSSCAHTFSSMSPESRHICYFFDYGALSLYSLGKTQWWSAENTRIGAAFFDFLKVTNSQPIMLNVICYITKVLVVYSVFKKKKKKMAANFNLHLSLPFDGH